MNPVQSSVVMILKKSDGYASDELNGYCKEWGKYINRIMVHRKMSQMYSWKVSFLTAKS